MSRNIGALVLAAGFSNRFGSIKLCAKLSNGHTVFQQTLDNILKAIPQTLVITRNELLPHLQDDRADFQVFHDAERGMGATLAFGALQLLQPGQPQWDGCLICLADMPGIHPETYKTIANAVAENTIVVPCYQGRPGNPIGFDQCFFARLSSLTGDTGGRTVIRENPQSVKTLELDDPAIFYDIDTPEDLANLDNQVH